MTPTQAPDSTASSPEDATRWRGFTHEELYRMLHEGPGATASATPSRRWAELAGALDEIGHLVRTSLDAAGTDWQGRAAGAAYQRLAPLSTWAKTASEGAAAMRVAVETQGDLIARARADMPTPEGVTPMAPDPTVPPAVQVVGAQADAEPVEAARAAGEQRAVEVMTAYETNSKQNLAVLVPFENPAELLRSGGVRRGGGPGVRLGTGVSGVGGHHGGHGHHGTWQPGPREPHHYGGTGSSGAHADLVRQRAALPAPGMLAGAAPMENFGAGPVALGAPREGDRVRERRAPGHAMGAGAGAGGADHVTGRDHTASTAGGDRNTIAGAPPPHGAAGAPLGAAGAGGAGGTVDKMGMRRFGTEAIGSTQWFADADAGPAPRAVAGRNRDLGSEENVTENVSVDGEDHHLPPPVIGG